MALALLNKCCFCIPLKVGALIMGYLQAIMKTGNIFYLISLYYIFVVQKNTSEISEKQMKSETVKNMAYINGFPLLLQIIISINLIIGLHKKQANRLRIFYIANPIFLVLITIMNTAESPNNGQWYPPLINFFLMAFDIFTVFIVLLRYLELKNVTEGTHHYITNGESALV